MEFDWGTIGAVVMAFGGWELIKHLMHRRSNNRKAEAEAEKAEVEVEEDKFKHLESMIVSLEERLEHQYEIISQKDAQFADQTSRLRETQDKLNATLEQLIEIKAKYVYVDTWKCVLGKCNDRKPPKPQLHGLKYDETNMPIDREEL